jgi:thioester reductase-like protein
VLLTGATGHLGPWLLAALLEAGVASVYALVRAGTEAEAAARIQGALAAIGRAELWSQASGRIVALPGQLGAPALGLSAARWRLLSEAIDSIVHSAAQVSFATTWHQLYPANVEGTREVIRLACEGRRKAIHHISTKGVFAPAAYPGDAPILEDEPLRTPRGDVIGYQQTKWAAEWLLEQARARGVPVAIYRPGRIAGDAHGRHMPEGDLFVRFARTCIDLGCAPEVGFALELTPVDWVAHAIAHIAQRSESIGHAFHLVHPEPLPLAEVVAELQRQGRSLCLVPYAEWRARLHARGGRGPLAPVLAMFAEALPTQLDDRRLAQDNTRTQLRGSDLVLPAVAVQLAQLVAHSFAKEPS